MKIKTLPFMRLLFGLENTLANGEMDEQIHHQLVDFEQDLAIIRKPHLFIINEKVQVKMSSWIGAFKRKIVDCSIHNPVNFTDISGFDTKPGSAWKYRNGVGHLDVRGMARRVDLEEVHERVFDVDGALDQAAERKEPASYDCSPGVLTLYSHDK